MPTRAPSKPAGRPRGCVLDHTVDGGAIGHDLRVSSLATARQAGPLSLLGTVSRTVGLAPTRPWLPSGVTLGGRIYRHGRDPAVGVPWLDEAGVLAARVRLSHALSRPGSRPGGAPAVTTIGLRLELPGAAGGPVTAADLVLRAGSRPRWSTGRRRAVRPGPGPLLVSGVPYAAAGRPLSFAALPCGAETFELLCAVDHERWRPFADLRVCPRPVEDLPLDPDPVRNPPPGLDVAGRAGRRAG